MNKPEMTHEEIVARCVQLDEKCLKEGLTVYFLDMSQRTFMLRVSSMHWSHLDEGERYCMVKYGNYFLSEDDAKSARARALDK